MEHSVLGASSAYRWMRCPGSVKLSKKLPKQKSSFYAKEGTAAHTLAERALRGTPLTNMLGQEIVEQGEKFKVNSEMIAHVGIYVKFVQNRALDAAVKPHIEKKFKLDWLYPGMWGTNDAGIGDKPNKHLTVCDLKFGQGKVVPAENNPQLLYYALGFLGPVEKADIYETADLVIVQPRTEDPIRIWNVPVRKIRQWGASVLLPAAQATDEEPNFFSPGKHCQYCPALAICDAVAKRNTEIARLEMHDGALVLPLPSEMGAEGLSKVLEGAELISSWAKSVRTYAQEQAEAGVSIPGQKLVRKRANRRWLEGDFVESQLVQLLGDDAFVKKWVSPAQAEKILKGKGLDKNALCASMYSPEAGLTLVSEKDRRKAATPPALEDFEDELKGN